MKDICNLLYTLHAKNNMPQELHHPTGGCIVQFRIKNPLPNLDIVIQRTLLHLIARNGELRTACRANLIRFPDVFLAAIFHFPVRRCVQGRRARSLKDVPPDLIGDVLVEAVLTLTAGIPIAAQVDVAVSLDEGELEVAHGDDVVVEWRIYVPGH